MPENRIYNNLLALPLFLGMSRKDLQQAAGQTRFDFRKIAQGETIVTEGEPCTHLYFLLDGDIMVKTYSTDRSYCIEEEIHAPETFQSERIFGLHPHFTHTYIALHDCSLLCLGKQDVMKLATRFDIFRINLLNLVSTQSQKHNIRTRQSPPKTLEERIVRFIESNCVSPSGEKTIHIKMTRIAEEVNDSRLDVSKALNHLQNQGLIQLFREQIYIPALEKLTNDKQ